MLGGRRRNQVEPQKQVLGHAVLISSVVNVRLVGPTWPGYLISAAIGLLGAAIGAMAVLKVARESQETAMDAQREEWARLRQAGLEDAERAASQHRRELLAKAADQLLDALWVKERELCDALHLARVAAREGLAVAPGDEALGALGAIELAIYKDLITALPFVTDPELRERLRSVGTVTNGCMNLRAVNEGGTWDEFSRAMIEVQAYFKWLRWNLALALQGDPLPDPAILPDVRRPLSEPGWQTPAGVPAYT